MINGYIQLFVKISKESYNQEQEISIKYLEYFIQIVTQIMHSDKFEILNENNH